MIVVAGARLQQMKIGVVVKKDSRLAQNIAKEILVYGHRSLGVEMFVEAGIAEDLGWSRVFSLDKDKVNVVVVVGGDGTLLRALQKLRFTETAVLGVKAGRRAFLLEVEPREALDRLRDVVEGRYRVCEYMRLEVLTEKDRHNYYALNDVVVASVRDERSEVVKLEVDVDGETLYTFDGDGVIIATPLGSTAYAFSAGGPVVDEDIEAIVVTPLAPMQPYARPVVLAPSRTVRVVNSSETDHALCIVDGNTVARLSPGESVAIKKATSSAKFICFRGVKTFGRVRACEF